MKRKETRTNKRALLAIAARPSTQQKPLLFNTILSPLSFQFSTPSYLTT